VNPEHLFLGTQRENMQDCKAKRRISHGEHRPGAKLTPDDVREIRRIYVKQSRVYGMRALAKKYGVNDGTIKLIFTGRNWSHVD
jgi:hypothetical protein